MPSIIHAKAIVTTIVQVENDDGSSFSLSRTRVSNYSSAYSQERKAALTTAVQQLAARFFDESAEEITNA